jgi:hypothetical protein
MWEYPLGTMSGLNLLATSTPSYVAMGVCPIELGPASVEIWDESPVTIGHVSARLRLDSAAARAVLTQLESHSATSDSYCTCDYIAASQAPGFLHRDHFWDGIAAACQGCNDSTWVVSLFLRFNGAQRSGSAERLEIRRLRTYDAG